MKKKILTFLLCAALAAGMAVGTVGCNNNSNGGSSGDNTQQGDNNQGNENQGGNGNNGNGGTNQDNNGNNGTNQDNNDNNDNQGEQQEEVDESQYGTEITFEGVNASMTATSEPSANAMAALYDGKATPAFEQYRNEKFYAHIKLNNPKHYQIRSVYMTYAGKETPFAAYNFNQNSSWNDVYIQIPAKGAEDISEYKVTKITYYENGQKKMVKLGDKSSFEISVKDVRSEQIKAAPVFTLTGDVYSVTNYSPSFVDANGKLTIPSTYNGRPVEEIGEYAFAYREDIKEIVIPDSISTIREGAFYYCLNAEKVEIGNKVFVSYKNAFYGCENISYVNYTGTLESWLNIRFGRTKQEQDEQDDIPNYDDKQEYRQSNPTTHAWDLHIKGKLVTEVIVPESITVVRDFAFSRCQSIKKVVLHDNVKKVGYGAFLTNSGIKELDLGNGLETIAANAFNGCYSLNELVIPESLINLLGGNSYVNSPFKACDKLYKVTNNSEFVSDTLLLQRMRDIDRSLLTLNGKMYNQNNEPLCEMTNSYEKAADGFVYMTNSLQPDVYYLQDYVGTAEELTLPTEYKGKPVRLGACVLAGCSLKKIIVPEGFEYIPARFAPGSLKLEEVVLPSTIKEIGNHAFWACSALKKLNVPAACEKLLGSAIDSGSSTLVLTIDSTKLTYAGSSVKGKNLVINYAGTIEQFIAATQNEIGVTNVYGNSKLLVHCTNGDYDPAEE